MGLQHPLFLCSRSRWLRRLPSSKHGQWSGRETKYQHLDPLHAMVQWSTHSSSHPPRSLVQGLGNVATAAYSIPNLDASSLPSSLTYWLTYLKLGASVTAPPPPQHGESHETHMTPPNPLLRLPTWWGASQTTWNPPRNWVPFLALFPISMKRTTLYLEYVISVWTLI